MAKPGYKVRGSLDKKQWDGEIVVRDERTGVGLPPMPAKYILVTLASFVCAMVVVMKTDLSKGPLWAVVLLFVAWMALTVLLVAPQGPCAAGVELVIAMPDYLPRRRRRVVCRDSAKDNGFPSIGQVVRVADGGKILWANGQVGCGYAVVGNASRFLFPRDRDAIVDGAEGFWNTVEDDVEYLTVTTMEAQQVWRQALALDERRRALGEAAEDLAPLFDGEYAGLKVIGDPRKNYRSLHQYLFLRASTDEALARARRGIDSDVAFGGLMFREARPMTRAEVEQVVSRTYRYSDR